MSYSGLLLEVLHEAHRADDKHGRQLDTPDGHQYAGLTAWEATLARDACQDAFAEGKGTWAHILVEEVAEALEETTRDPALLRAELLQVAAVAVRWIDVIDQRVR